jgi:hypothetical protein
MAGPAADSVQSRFWSRPKKLGFPGFESRFGRNPGFGKSGIPIWPESRIRETGNPDYSQCF